MALKPLNSVGGFSVGEVPANVILANADITANNATFSGNVRISNATASWGVLTDNLYYSNGQPWDFQQAAGANGELQFNMGDDFAASPNLTFNNSTQLFTVTGNANITGTLTAGALEVDEIFNGNSNVAIPVANGNVNISVAGNANVLVVTGTGANVAGYVNATGAITGANLALTDGNITSTGTSGLYLTPANSTAGIVVQANTAPNANNSFNLGSTSKVFANIYGNNVIVSANLDSGNANLGNFVTANYVNVNNDLNVVNGIYTGNIQVNVSANFSNVQVANFVVSNLTPASDDQYYLGTTTKRWKDINIAGNANIVTANISGNVTAGNIEFGNLLTGNYATFDNDIQVIGNIANANNISATNGIFANNANITANLTSGNANLGNLAQANFVNVSQNLNVTGNIAGTYANLVGNLHIDPSGANNFGILTDHLYYANGTAWDLQEAAGSNTEIQYNLNDNFAASANFTYDDTTQVFKVTGNANITNTLLTPNVDSGAGNLTLTSNGFSTVYDTTGNVTFPGDITANTVYANINGNITTTAANTSVLFSDAGLISGATGFTFDKSTNVFVTPGNIDVNGELLVTGNANFAGNSITISQNYITGNGTGIVLKDDTNGAQLEWNSNAYVYVDNTGASLEANAFIATLDFDGNFSLPNNLSVVGNIANANNISVTNALAANTGNFSGNITSLNANLGNLADANYIRTGELMNGNSNVVITANGNILFSVTGLANVHTFSNAGINVVGYVEANGNGTFGALYSNTLTAQGGNLTLYAATGDNYVELRPTGNGTVDVGNHRITSLATPTQSTDAATKAYVDAAVEGLHVHAPSQAATPDTLANISGGAITYNNGSSGVGATLTTTGTYTVIDGVNIATVGTRILVKSEANTAHNGIYTYTSSTVLTRATDYDTPTEMAGGDFTFVQQGTLYNDTGWVMTDPVTTVGTSPVIFYQFSGAGTYTAGPGLTLTGTQFSVNVDNLTTEIAGGNVVVKANAQLTTPNIGAATGTSLDLTGNVLANNLNSNNKVTAVNFEATGNILAANISANANLVVNNANVNLALNGNTASFSGNVVVPNLTVNLELAGNTANFSGNVVVANFIANGVANVGNLHVNANVTTSLLPNANLTLDLGASGQRWKDAYVGNLDASGNLTLGGNLSANNFVANTLVANTSIDIGNSAIYWGEVTTTSTSANQTVSTVTISGVTGVEWIVKGIDSTGSKYSMAMVTAVTDGTSVDYSTFGGVNLGATTGTIAVNVVGSNVELQVTPSSSNSTVWVTQYRTI